MGRTVDRGLLGGVGLVLAVLLVSAAVTYRNTWQLDEDARWVVHTHQVQDLTAEVLLDLVDAETGERGFLITGKDGFLQPYDDALTRLDERLARLKQETEDNERQQVRIQQLRGMIASELALLKQGIDIRRKSADEARAFTAGGKGKKQMDAIRVLVAQMKLEENRLLEDRERRSKRAYQVAVGTGIVTALAGLASVAAFVSLLRRSLAARKRAMDSLADLYEEQARLRTEAQEHRERLRVTLTSIGDGVIATDTAGRVTFLNPAAEALTGWARPDAEGQPLETVFPILNEYTRRPAENPVARVLRDGTVVGLANHTALISRDGTERPVADSAAPIRDERGQVAGVVLIFRDVSAERRADEARRMLAAIVESSEDAILGQTLDGVVTSWNKGAERLYGYAAEEVVGRPSSMLSAPDRAEELAAVLDKVRRREVTESFETVRRCKDGTLIDVAVNVSPITDAGGQVIGASTIARDVTRRKQAERTLRQSEERFARFMQHLPGLAWVKDVQGRYVYANDAAVKAFRRSREDLYGKTDEEVFPPETAAQFRENDRRALASATGVQVVETLKHDDGVLHYSIVSKFAIPGPDQGPALVGGMAIDVTEHRQAEQTVRASEERLRLALEAGQTLRNSMS
jgi:PAS domain S-box-containing protein